MYQEFYGLSDDPFNITPDPKFLYLSKKHEEGLRNLLYGVENKKGLIVMTGEVGTGKTVLLNCLIQNLKKKSRVAFLVDPQPSSTDMFKNIFYQFGLPFKNEGRADMLIKLREFIVSCADQQEDCILMLDEAQDYSYETLEQLRLLLNIETHKEKLLQIVMVGHPELRSKLNSLELSKIKKRVDIIYNLLPLHYDETVGYVEKRLTIAGATKTLFTAAALKEVHRFSAGTPRLINILCDLALLTGFSNHQPRITPPCILQAAEMAGLYDAATPSTHRVDSEPYEGAVDTGAALEAGTAGVSEPTLLPALPELPEGVWKAEPIGAYERLPKQRRLVYFCAAAAVGLVSLGGWRWFAGTTDDARLLDILPYAVQQLLVPAEVPTETLVPRKDAGSHAPSLVSPATAMTSADAPPKPALPEGVARVPDRNAVPVQTAPPAPLSAVPGQRLVVVQAGETLGRIMQREYGQYRQNMLAMVLKANPDLTVRARIYPNQVIVLPPLEQ